MRNLATLFVLGALFLLQGATTATGEAASPGGEDLDRRDIRQLIVSGDAIRLTPDPISQSKSSECSNRGLAHGATIGPTHLPILFSVSPDPKFLESKPYDRILPCNLHVNVAGREASDTPTGLNFGAVRPPDRGWASAEVYLIGSAPHALLIATVENSDAVDHDLDVSFYLYVARGGKLVEFAEEGSEKPITVDVHGATITIAGADTAYDESLYPTLADWRSRPPVQASFVLDYDKGRIRWHAATVDASRTVQSWLNGADPAFRAAQAEREKTKGREVAAELAARPDQQSEQAYPPANGFAQEPSCSDFLAATQEQSTQPMLVYLRQVERHFDELDMQRGCQSAIGSLDPRLTAANTTAFVYRMCGASPSQPLYEVAKTLYGMDRAASKLGFGDGCR